MTLIVALALLMSVSAEDAAAQTAECKVAVLLESRRISQVVLRCPEDAPDAAGLQAAADAVASRLALPLDLSALRPLATASTLQFRHSLEGWALPGPVSFLGGFPSYPSRAVERGVEARCDSAVAVAASGEAETVRTQCQAFHSEGRAVSHSGFDQAAGEAIARTRWFTPVGADTHCIETKYIFQLETGSEKPWLEGPVEGAPQCL